MRLPRRRHLHRARRAGRQHRPARAVELCRERRRLAPGSGQQPLRVGVHGFHRFFGLGLCDCECLPSRGGPGFGVCRLYPRGGEFLGKGHRLGIGGGAGVGGVEILRSERVTVGNDGAGGVGLGGAEGGQLESQPVIGRLRRRGRVKVVCVGEVDEGKSREWVG